MNKSGTLCPCLSLMSKSGHLKGTGNLQKTNTRCPWQQLAAPSWYLGKAACGDNLLTDPINAFTNLVASLMIFYFFIFYCWWHIPKSLCMKILGILLLKGTLKIAFLLSDHWSCSVIIQKLIQKLSKTLRVRQMWLLNLTVHTKMSKLENNLCNRHVATILQNLLCGGISVKMFQIRNQMVNGRRSANCNDISVININPYKTD